MILIEGDEEMLSACVVSIPLMYFSIISRSLCAATLFMVTMMPLESNLMKSAVVFDLMFLSNLLMFATWSLNLERTLDAFSEFMGMMICRREGPFVVMLNLGFLLLVSLTVLCISSVFLADKFGKFSLRLRIR